MNFYSILGILLIIVILIIAKYFGKKAVIKRQLTKAPLKKLHSFRDGETAKITGKAEPVDYPLIAPLSKRECCHYYVCIEEKVSSGKSSHWNTLIEDEMKVPYVINDDGDYAYIAEKKFKNYLIEDWNFRSGFMNDATPALEKYLNENGHKSENFFHMNKTIRYREGIVEVGETVAVLGRGKWEKATAHGLPERYGYVLAMMPDETGNIYMSDDPKTVINTQKSQDML